MNVVLCMHASFFFASASIIGIIIIIIIVLTNVAHQQEGYGAISYVQCYAQWWDGHSLSVN